MSSSAICPSCGREAGRRDQFCADCGARVRPPRGEGVAAPATATRAAGDPLWTAAPPGAPTSPSAATLAPQEPDEAPPAPSQPSEDAAPPPEPPPEPPEPTAPPPGSTPPQPGPTPPPPDPTPPPPAQGSATGDALSEITAQLRRPVVATALLAAVIGAAITFGAALAVAQLFGDDYSFIGALGQDADLITEAMRYTVSFLLAGFGPEPERFTPVAFVAIPVVACMVGLAAQAASVRALGPRARYAVGASTGVPFGLLMLIPALASGEVSEAGEASVGGAILLGALWGAIGGLLAVRLLTRGEHGRPSSGWLARLRPAVATVRATLMPLVLVLAFLALVGAGTWVTQVMVGDPAAGLQRSTAVAVSESVLYAGEHGVHLLELGAGVQFQGTDELEARTESPLPVADGEALEDDFRLFTYRSAMPVWLFITAILVLTAAAALGTLLAGFSVARVRAARDAAVAAAWGALVGPIWAVAMGILDIAVGKDLLGRAQPDSVFAVLLLGGTILGALGGLLAGRSPREG